MVARVRSEKKRSGVPVVRNTPSRNEQSAVDSRPDRFRRSLKQRWVRGLFHQVGGVDQEPIGFLLSGPILRYQRARCKLRGQNWHNMREACHFTVLRPNLRRCLSARRGTCQRNDAIVLTVGKES
jgi:hypothetical protein